LGLTAVRAHGAEQAVRPAFARVQRRLQLFQPRRSWTFPQQNA
jgi:hypothetical protein